MGTMKPYPFWELNHFTVPVFMSSAKRGAARWKARVVGRGVKARVTVREVTAMVVRRLLNIMYYGVFNWGKWGYLGRYYLKGGRGRGGELALYL